jgi:type IV pilus assembly protein PilC
MMGSRSFFWKALDQDGRIIQGTWDVNQASDVRTQLFSQGYYPLKILPKRRVLFTVLSYVDDINKKSDQLRIWAGMTRRLSIILQAGIPLLQALEILGEQDKHSRFSRFKWDQVIEQLEGGKEFSEALDSFVPSPTPYIRSMILASEQAGRLPQVLAQIADELDQEIIFHRKLQGAYAYPSFLLLLALGVIYALSVFVLPVYERIFTNLETELPKLTQVIFKITGLLPQIVLFLLVSVVGGLVALRIHYSETWREKVSQALSRIPFFGKIYRLNDCVRFAQGLGTLLGAGIPLVEAINLTGGTLRTFQMKKMIVQLGFAAREGRRLAPILRLNRSFPNEASQMLAVGEESGQLSEMLVHMGKMFRMDLEDQMEKLPRILGPLFIVILSGIIGLVAIGVLLPVFDVGTHLK